MWLSDIEEFRRYSSKPWNKCDMNMLNVPINWIEATDAGADEFNKIYYWILDNKVPKYVKTKSGGICKKPSVFRRPCYNINITKSSIEIVYIDYFAYRFRFRSGYKESEEDTWGVSGSRGFEIFKRMVKNYGGNMADLAIDNGKEVKATMPAPMIYCKEEYIGQTLENVYHADINSAYMAGIKEYASTMRYKDLEHHDTWEAICKTIDELYTNRKSSDYSKKHYKAVLNVSYGFMQSQWCRLKGHGYALAHLSKIAMESCINKLLDFTSKQERFGGTVIGYNTDGVFFIPSAYDTAILPSKLAHPDTRLGEFKIDTFCKKIRFKSHGAYEYIDQNDDYKPVVRGRTRLDYIKPRSEWEWGDIYQQDAQIVRFKFMEGLGVLK